MSLLFLTTICAFATTLLALRAPAVWKQQLQFQIDRGYASDIRVAAAKCALLLTEARQSGLAPLSFLPEKYASLSEDVKESYLRNGFALYLLKDKAERFEILDSALAVAEGRLESEKLAKIRDLIVLRDAIGFHSSRLAEAALNPQDGIDYADSLSYCFRTARDHSIEDRIDLAITATNML